MILNKKCDPPRLIVERGIKMKAGKISERYPEGKEEALLAELMAEFGTELTYLAYSYVKNSEDAKDIVQNVFVTAYRHLNEVQENYVKSWLYRVTINKCKDHLKSSLVRRVVPFGLPIEKKESEPSLETSIIDKEFSSSVRKAVFKLKLKYREVVFMRYFQDLSISEIASVLKLPEATVRTRLRRANEQMGQILKKEGFIYE
ncbi:MULTISPECIES: sigma-70 family RNA polymerase sigma factor [Bacillus]|uniref:Sigma-70 family RNA polymerase sigma factor n=1 Tax=Bacillus infantis TaxID=324767 RepID=A0A5D4SNG6_9BACI|nr:MULTISPECIES: sigma-70 family RNA polymerase sigma factor [Bacillus]PLR73609.1 RNA polymerase factor sigma C [Bacillus sp. UMB0728]TYS63864.1 sigma-70 family RNA polymerase sigma factor [Bacillus infantis]